MRKSGARKNMATISSTNERKNVAHRIAANVIKLSTAYELTVLRDESILGI